MNTAFILAQLAIAQAAIDTIRAECEPPPPPVPPAPSLAIATHYGWNALTFEFAAAAADNGAFFMQYRAHQSDTTGHGPQEWTDLPTTGVPNLSVPNSADRILEVRAWCERDGVRSDDATLVLALNDYAPPEETQPPAEG